MTESTPGSSDAASPDVAVADVPAASRYEGRVADGADLALACYRLDGRSMTFTHTEVPPAFEGRGVGSALVRHALDDARRRGLSVVPMCPFVAEFIRRHDEYADLVAPDARAEHGLA